MLIASFFASKSVLWSAFFLMATVSSTLLVVQIVLMFIGIGGDGDADVGADVSADVGHDIGGAGHMDAGMVFTLLSLQSILAFFVGTGWSGLFFLDDLLPPGFGIVAMLLSLIVGGVMMVASAYLGFMFRRLTSVATVDLTTCIGKTANVYLRIPEHGQGTGQVEVVLSSGKKIMKARSVGPAVQSFTSVRVLSIDDDGETLAVEPVGAAPEKAES